MKTIKTRITTQATVRCLSAGLVLLFLTSVAQSQPYAITDLGNLGGTNCIAYGINSHEQVVGTSQTAAGNFHAFMFDGGRMMDLGTLGGSNSWAYGINDDGSTVGASDLSMGSMHGFLWTNSAAISGMMDLGTLGGTNSAAQMINLHGEMVGWTDMGDGSHHAFLMTNAMPGNMMDLGTVGGVVSEALCINSNRMIVGYSTMPNGGVQPIMSTNGILGMSSMMNMGMSNMGSSGGQSSFVNDMGMVVGQANMPGGNHRAFVSGGGGMMGGSSVDLGALGGTNSSAFCINNAGTVVGTAEITNRMPHGFMMTNASSGMAQMMDLNGLVPTNSGWEMIEARGINDSGQIVGCGMFDGHTNAFLLTPVSGPVMMVSAPSAQIVGLGDSVILHMQMSSSEPLTYQWMHDGVSISGATNSTLVVPGMSMGTVGQYTAMARNGVGTVAHASAPVSMFSMAFGKGAAELTMSAPSGSQFRMEFSDRLGTGANWQTLTNLTVKATTSVVTDIPPLAAQARFYRAVMTP